MSIYEHECPAETRHVVIVTTLSARNVSVRHKYHSAAFNLVPDS